MKDVPVKHKVYFRSNSRSWSTHTGYIHDALELKNMVERMCASFKEVKVKTYRVEETIIK